VQGRKRYAKDQVSTILGQYAQGVPVRVLTARFGVSPSTLRRWRLRAAAADGGRQRTLEHENRSLRRRIGDLSADKTFLQRLLRRESD
jgi:transposase-like protein